MSKSRDRRRRHERRERNVIPNFARRMGMPLAPWQLRVIEAHFADYRRRHVVGIERVDLHDGQGPRWLDYRGRGA